MTILYVFSGSGNSLWVAKQLAKLLGDCEIRPASVAALEAVGGRVTSGARTESPKGSPPGGPEAASELSIGIVFPVYMWGPPWPVREFAKALKPANTGTTATAGYLFAVAVNAGQVANSLAMLDADLRANYPEGLQAGFSVQMPSSYIPWGGAEPLERQAALDEQAAFKLESIAAAVRGKSRLDLERGPLWQRLLLSGLAHSMAAPQVPGMARSFYSTAACTGCGQCARVCPTGNVRLADGRPQWGTRCSQCFACLQWCPEQAIEYGKATVGKARYHHRAVSVADFAGLKPSNTVDQG